MVAIQLTSHSWVFTLWFWNNPQNYLLDAGLNCWSRKFPRDHVLTPWRIWWINSNWTFWSPRGAAKVHGARKSCFANRSRIKCRDRSVAVGASSEWCRKLLWRAQFMVHTYEAEDEKTSTTLIAMQRLEIALVPLSHVKLHHVLI